MKKKNQDQVLVLDLNILIQITRIQEKSSLVNSLLVAGTKLKSWQKMNESSAKDAITVIN